MTREQDNYSPASPEDTTQIDLRALEPPGLENVKQTDILKNQETITIPDKEALTARLHNTLNTLGYAAMTSIALTAVSLNMARGGNFKSVRGNLTQQGKANAKEPLPVEQKKKRRRKRKKK